MLVRFRAIASVAALVATLGASGAARAAQPSASDRATARSLAVEGQKALDRKDYALALDRFTRANKLVPAPTLALRVARAQVGLGKLVEAQETYNRIIRAGAAPDSPAVFQQAVDDAKQEVAGLAPRLAWLTITVEGPTDARVTIDGAPVSPAEIGVRRAIDPGPHVVRVSSPGYASTQRDVTVTEGQSGSVQLTPERAATSAGGAPPPVADSGSAPSTWQRPVGFVALGVGALGLVVGSVEGAVAIHKHSQLGDACPGGTCPPDQGPLLDSYRTAGTIATAGFVVGAVGIGAGITLLLTAPKSGQTAYVAPYVGLARVGAVGRF